jgi:predicted lipid-binding transport protein (Tim44 family)
MFRRRWLTAFIMIAAAFVLVTADAHARPLSGLSAGSRGMRTYSLRRARPLRLVLPRSRNMTAAPSYAAAYPATGHSFAALLETSNSASATASGPLTIAKSDYDAFERLLSDIQGAFSTEDLSTLRAMVTPEMPSYFSEQLADNASRGLINRVTDVKLLQGDLAEARREGRNDYATLAMKYALKDSMVERASGRIVEGRPGERLTELWTFMRARGGNWLLSAIQQT